MKQQESVSVSSRLGVDDTIVSSHEALWCDLHGEAMILNLTSGVYFGLEGIGSDLWAFIQTPHTLTEIIDHLCSRFDVRREVCQETIVNFLSQLAQHNLILIKVHA